MFAVGDLVVCVDAKRRAMNGYRNPRVKEGRHYRVVGTGVSERGHQTVWLAGVRYAANSTGSYADRFRKIDKADEGFCLWMRSMRPIKQDDKVFAEKRV